MVPNAGMAAVSSPGRKLSSRSTQKHTGTHSLLPSFLSTSALVSKLSQFVRGGPWHPCSARRLRRQNSPWHRYSGATYGVGETLAALTPPLHSLRSTEVSKERRPAVHLILNLYPRRRIEEWVESNLPSLTAPCSSWVGFRLENSNLNLAS